MHKPVRHPKLGVLTDEDFAEVNWGYDTPVYAGFNSFVMAYESGVRWTYKKPRGGISEPFRLSDFNGYNHYAPDLFQFEAISSSVAQNRYLGIEVSSLLSFLSWDAWKSYGPSYQNLNFGVVGPYLRYYPLTGIDSIIDITDQIRVLIAANVFNVGETYQLFPAITTYQAAQGTWVNPGSEGTWWIVPAEKISFTVKALPSPIDLVNISGAGATAVLNGNTITVSDIRFDVFSDLELPITCSVYASVSSPFSGTISIGSTSFSVAAKGSYSGGISGSASYEPIDPSYAVVTLLSTMTYQGTQYNKTIRFNVDVQ